MSRARSTAAVRVSTSSSICCVALRADIHLGAGRLRDGVDAGAAFDHADIDGGFGRAVEPRFGEQRHGPAERVNRVADAVIAPAMAAGPGEGDFEAAAAQRPGGDVIGVGAVHHQEGAESAGRAAIAGRDGACR